jgi:hypothetical protein
MNLYEMMIMVAIALIVWLLAIVGRRLERLEEDVGELKKDPAHSEIHDGIVRPMSFHRKGDD